MNYATKHTMIPLTCREFSLSPCRCQKWSCIFYYIKFTSAEHRHWKLCQICLNSQVCENIRCLFSVHYTHKHCWFFLPLHLATSPFSASWSFPYAASVFRCHPLSPCEAHTDPLSCIHTTLSCSDETITVCLQLSECCSGKTQRIRFIYCGNSLLCLSVSAAHHLWVFSTISLPPNDFCSRTVYL